MPRSLVPATGALLDEILDDTFPIWSEGLSRQAYARYNEAQLRTPWGSKHLRRLALVEDGRVLASAKRYDLGARLDGRPVRVLGIGAVFTPPALRGRGFAQELMRRMMAEAAGEGVDLAILFSEIGPRLYERLGFTTVPLEQVVLRVRQKPGAPAVLVRGGEDRDARAIAEMHAARADGHRFALERDADLVRYAVAKKRLLAGLGPPGLRSVEFQAAEEGGNAVAYVILLVSRDGWMVTECGDRDPSGPRLGAILQALLARAPEAAAPVIRAWLPRGFVPPQVEITARERPSVVMMVRPLGEGVKMAPDETPGGRGPRMTIDPPLGPNDTLYWHGDVF